VTLDEKKATRQACAVCLTELGKGKRFRPVQSNGLSGEPADSQVLGFSSGLSGEPGDSSILGFSSGSSGEPGESSVLGLVQDRAVSQEIRRFRGLVQVSVI